MITLILVFLCHSRPLQPPLVSIQLQSSIHKDWIKYKYIATEEMTKTGELNVYLWEIVSGQEKPAKKLSGEKIQETYSCK